MNTKITWEEIQQESNRRLREWRKNNPKKTFTEIEREVSSELAKQKEKILEVLLAEQENGERELCPDCHVEMTKNGHDERTLQGKEGVKVKINRRQWKCPNCKGSFFPSGQ